MAKKIKIAQKYLTGKNTISLGGLWCACGNKCSTVQKTLFSPLDLLGITHNKDCSRHLLTFHWTRFLFKRAPIIAEKCPRI